MYQGRDFYISEEDVEGDRYRVFHQASTGFSGTSGIRRTATQRASEFCRILGHDKIMLTVSEHTASPPYILGNFPRIEIIFVCIDKENNHAITKSTIDKYDRLSKIKELLVNGVLTKEEFNLEKKKILSKE